MAVALEMWMIPTTRKWLGRWWPWIAVAYLSVLRLKIGAPVILLRNLDPLRGLCNGARRMIILRVSTRCLEVRLDSGSFDGEKRLIYWTKLTSNVTDFHFQLTLFNFPVHLAFAMTIKKSQGQSLTHVGIDLWSSVFSHDTVNCMWRFPRNGCPQHCYTDQGIQCLRGHR